jgi:hypothetical protein
MRLKVIIAGTRTFADYELLKTTMNDLKLDIEEVVCGEATGADALGKQWAEENKLDVMSFPADWKRYGRKAGYVRNQQMAYYADALVAFWDGKSKGTKMMIRIMSSSQKPYFVINVPEVTKSSIEQHKTITNEKFAKFFY